MIFGILQKPALNILAKLQGIVFGHAFKYGFQNHALRTVRHVLGHVLNPYPVLLTPILIEGDLFPVPAKTINLPYDDHRELLLGRI